jgi:hypothetical protein
MTTQDCTKGIIVGLCSKQEYLLPYFYLNLRLHTNLPITFFDYGMSTFGKSFCEKRGHVIELDTSIKKGHSTDPKFIIKKGWYKKPLACDLSPYDLTLWLDLDCKIHQNFEKIFEYVQDHDFVIVKSPKHTKKSYTRKLLKKRTSNLVIYNSGVIGFKKGSKIIKEWVRISEKMHAICRGDEDTLSFLLSQQNQLFYVLDKSFNLIQSVDTCDNVIISHHISKLKENLLKEHLFLENMPFQIVP